MNKQDIEVYKNSFNYYFINNVTNEEGKIILGSNTRGNEFFKYVSHLEECEEITEEREQEYIFFFEANFNLITEAKNL